MFDGADEIVGAGDDDAANAASYMNVVLSRYFDPAPVSINIDSFDPATGNVSATVEMYSESLSLSSTPILFALVEDDVSGENTRITRKIISDTISLSGAGNAATFNETFAVDSGWNAANLQVVAFIQQADKKILQAGSTYDRPEYMIRAMTASDRIVFGSSSSFEFDPITVKNVGLSDNFSIRVVVDDAPFPGWSVSFRDAGGTVHTGSYAFILNAEASTTFSAIVNPASRGYISYHFEISSPNLSKNLDIPMGYLTDDIDVLLIDDDGGNDYEDYFTAALAHTGKAYGVWDLSVGKLPAAAQSIPMLIWNVGLGYPSLDPTDRGFLEQYLDAGGALFISGQDVGWDLNDSASSNRDPTFYHDYLHADYLADDTNIMDIDGIPGDPVSDGLMLHIAGGDGADNEDYPSRIAPHDADATGIFSYHGQAWTAAIRSVDSVSSARIVYLAFGYEAIDNSADRTALMRSATQWLANMLFGDDFEDGNLDSWSYATGS